MPIADPSIRLSPVDCPFCQAQTFPADQPARGFSGIGWRDIERAAKKAKKKFISDPLEKSGISDFVEGLPKQVWEILSPVAKEAWKQLQRAARHAIDVMAQSSGIPMWLLRRILRNRGVDVSELTDQELCELRVAAYQEAFPGRPVPADICGDQAPPAWAPVAPAGTGLNLATLGLIGLGLFLLFRGGGRK